MTSVRRRRKGGGAAMGFSKGGGTGGSARSVADIRARTKQHNDQKHHSPKEAADCAFRDRNFDKAVEMYGVAISSHGKKDAVLYANRSAAYCALGKFGRALNDAKIAVSIDPTWPKAHFRLGYAAEKSSQYEEALSYYTSGLAQLNMSSSSASSSSSSSGMKAPSNAAKKKKKGKQHDERKAQMEKLLTDAKTRVGGIISALDLSSRIETDTKDKFYKMVDWLRKGGAKFPDLYLRRYSQNHRGVHALKELEPQQQILFVPLEFIMTSEMAKASAMCKLITKAKAHVESSHTWLAVYLLQERAKGKGSFFEPYISILPESFPTIPLFFTDKYLKMLKGSFSLGKIARRLEHLRDEYNAIVAKVPSFKRHSLQDFIWARLVIITRIFGITVNGVKTDGLVPYADMLNHKIPRETAWCYNDDSQGFSITTVTPIGRGEEVFDSYGRKCNHRFFVNYGFALDDNHEDNEAVLTITMDGAEAATPGSRKRHILGALFMSPLSEREFQVPASFEEKTQRMFGFCRVCCMTENQLLLLADGQREAAETLEGTGPVNIANEIKALEMIKTAAKTALGRFSTEIESDEKLLEEKKYADINERNCIVMRLGEKKVLQWFVDMAGRAQEMLQMSFYSFRSKCVQSMYEDRAFDVYSQKVIEPLLRAERFP